MAKPSNGISPRRAALSRRSSWKERALHDPKDRLRRIAPRRQAARRPAMRDLDRGPGARFVRGRGDALIERHHDVAADRHLRFDAEFRAEENGSTVEIALEDRAFLAHRARMRERENLESAGVGQDGAIPAHEAVNAAGATEDFRAGPEQQVIGVCEQDLRAGFLERARQLRLDRRLRPDRHEERRLHFVVQGAKGRGARMRIGRDRFETKMQTRSSHEAGRVRRRLNLPRFAGSG